MRRLLLMVCVCLAVPSLLLAQEPAATNRNSWLTTSVQPPPRDHEIHRERILPVPSGHAKDAVAMLQAKSSVPLSLPEAAKLLEVASIDPDALLEQAAQKEDAEADKRERVSKDPFFAGDTAEKMKQWAKEHRQTAAQARSLKGKTKPYLVRGLVLSEGTGSFSACLKDPTLWVYHGCLGRHAVPMKRQPVVVFLEQEPKTVYVDVSMAE
jgi:hypothetical protein